MTPVRIGRRYRHFKGPVYVVTGVALHSETEEAMVLYHREGWPGKLWARPASMWSDVVGQREDGRPIHRFEEEP